MKNLSYRRYFLLLLTVFLLILAGLSSLSHGPKPKMDSVPLHEFSAGRALIHLSDMIGDNKPHPSGSAKNKEILQIISGKFSALGYEPEVQKTLACTPHYPGCTQVENFIAVLKGSGNGDAVMLTTHYDSVPAGPGAGDAGAGVASLIEIARILKAEPRPVNDVIFLITDGEEGGLRGAQGFATEHPLMKSVKLVINLEARGAAGPSTMFETQDGNRTLIKHFGKASKHPVANSLSFEIYKRLPNDTDYSIYKPMGVAGLNYAFTGDVALYHSARDDIAHLDKSSLQHHGDNALDAVRAFRNMDLSNIHSDTNATYFDLFGRVLLNWSSGLNLPLSIMALIVMAVATFKTHKSWRQDFLNTEACILVILLTVLIGFALSFPLGKWPELFYLDHPYPWPGRIALMTGAGFAPWVIAKLFRKNADISYNMLAVTVGVLLALLSLLAAILMTGAAYQFLVPALAMAIGFIIGLWRKHERFTWAVHLGLVTTAYMAIYHFIALEVIVPYSQAQLRMVPLIPLGLVLLPVFLRAGRKEPGTTKLLGFSLGVVTISATVLSFLLPGFTTSHPRNQNFMLQVDTQKRESYWLVGGYGDGDETFYTRAGFSDGPQDIMLYGINPQKSYIKKAKYRDLPPPQFNLVSDSLESGKRILIGDIKASNAGYGIHMRFPADSVPQDVFVNDKVAAKFGSKLRDSSIAIRGPGDYTYRVKLVYAKDTKVEFALEESISLTPDQTDGLDQFRLDVSAPGFDGDKVQVFRHLVFQ